MNKHKKRIKWVVLPSACRTAVGTEQEYEGVLLTRAARKPPDFWAENDTGVKCLLRKHLGKVSGKGWDVLLPGGGVHTFKTKRDACRFIARLVRVEEEPAVVLKEEEE